MDSSYVSWLRCRGVKLFTAGGESWRFYHRRALIPATLTPCYIKLTSDESSHLLSESGAWLLRYSSDRSEQPTQWWYVLCDNYDPQALKSDMRTKIKLGRRKCRVSQVSAEWMAAHGYACYVAAHTRYKSAKPTEQDSWRKGVLATINGPMEWWVVSVGEEMAGYAMCVVEGKSVNMASLKGDPTYFKQRAMSALISCLGEHYVRDMAGTLTNGNRPVLHDTNFQEFLMHHGFRQEFCHLNIVYQKFLGRIISAAFPLRNILSRLPETGPLQNINSLLVQEEIRRTCQANA